MSKENKKSVYKPKAISGYPEWLPEVRYVEQQWFDHIRRVFESYGFCNIETPSVEELDVISAKGEVDKEIYVLERLHQDEDDHKEARLALHFDQTVPLARYVAQHFGDLVFPFKRYQMQRVWRGERPQKGRFREFYQCDIDVIGVDQLGLHFDAEMPAIIYEILSGLPGMENEKFQLKINNRKILLGLLSDVASPDAQTEILRVLDKRLKLSKEDFEKQLTAILEEHIAGETDRENTLSDLNSLFEYRDTLIKLSTVEQIEKLQAILSGHVSYENYQEHKKNSDLPKFKVPSIDFYDGMKDLITVMKGLTHLPDGAVAADFFMVRGLDYYTGTVYETMFVGNEGFGSICSGGRYDDLASSYINKNLPGVGISIGFSRLFSYMVDQGKLPVGRKSPADILMVLPNEDQRAAASATAQTLRKRGVKVELFDRAIKIGKQMAYAEKKGIPYVWFPPFDDDGNHEVKDMASGEQSPADPRKWTLPSHTDQKGQIDDAA